MTIRCVWTARLYFTNWAYAAEMRSEQHMLPRLCGFNSQVRVNVLSYNLICSSVGMLGYYMNFMNWFLFDLGAECI